MRMTNSCNARTQIDITFFINLYSEDNQSGITFMEKNNISEIMDRNITKEDLKEEFGGLVKDIKTIMAEARADSARALNQSILQANWRRGQRIVEELQNGERRAKYGSNLIATISKVLTIELGKGYGERSIRNYRQFYLDFQILHGLILNQYYGWRTKKLGIGI